MRQSSKIFYSFSSNIEVHFCGKIVIVTRDGEDFYLLECFSKIMWMISQRSSEEQIKNVILNEFGATDDDFRKLIFSLQDAGFIKSDKGECLYTGIPGVCYPKHAIFEITNVCNLSCRFCYKNANKMGTFMDISSFNDIITKISRGTYSVLLTGGEPLMHPEFSKMVELVSEHGMRVGLITNGILLHMFDVNILRMLDHIQISLYGLTEDSYQKKTGHCALGDFLKSVHYLKDNDIVFTVSYLLTDECESDVEEIFAFFNNHGIEHVRFGLVFNEGRSLNQFYTESEESHFKSIIKQVSKKYPSIHVNMWNDRERIGKIDENSKFLDNDGFPVCGGYVSRICFSENMRIKPCNSVCNEASVDISELQKILCGEYPRIDILKNINRHQNPGCRIIEILNDGLDDI